MNKKDEISEIILIGMNHKTAPVEVRELFSLSTEVRTEFMNRARADGIDEIVYLSTCNRVEVYCASCDVHRTVTRVIELIAEYSGLAPELFTEHLYRKYSRDAVLHLLTVASSLDSMVVGENEILGQIKQAYRDSVHHQHSGLLLNRLFHQAFNTAKKVRTDTGISQNPLSIAYIAVEQARAVLGQDLACRRALLVGAGEMGELILKYLTKCSVGDITIANRSLKNAEIIVEGINKEAHVIPLEDMIDAAADVDIIITSVASRDYLLNGESVAHIMQHRSQRPLILIDIAVPRNIDPEVANSDGVSLYNIDDLKRIADENLKNRLSEVEVAREIVGADATELFDWYEGLEIVPVIVKIQESFNRIRSREVEKYRRRKMKHLSEDDFAIVDELTKQIMSKVLHNPIMVIKENRLTGVAGYHSREAIKQKIDIIEELFKQ